jgi:CubicO group peptidase (beta-lactamase class C family)
VTRHDVVTAALDDARREWPSSHCALGAVSVSSNDVTTWQTGPGDAVFALASVTKVLTAVAAALAVEEGVLDLDLAVRADGATRRHLLAHASGLPFDVPAGEDPLAAPSVAAPGTKRIYSNAGIDAFAQTFHAATGFGVAEYFDAGIAEPLGLQATRIIGAPSRDGQSCVDDLLRLALILLTGSLLAPSTVESMRTVQYPDLAGLVPGIGSFRPNPWGLGVEVRGQKQPHWTGATNSPSTFGHFGAAGTFVWVDPEAGVALVGLGDAPFGPWAPPLWSRTADAVLAGVTMIRTR